MTTHKYVCGIIRGTPVPTSAPAPAANTKPPDPKCPFCAKVDPAWSQEDLKQGWRSAMGWKQYHCHASYRITTSQQWWIDQADRTSA